MKPSFLPPMILASLLLVPSLALAQADKVWIDCRHGEPLCTAQDELAELEDAFLEAGASEVVISTELPENISDGSFKLVVMILPTLPLGTPELTNILPGFLSGGGRLVLLAENDGTESAGFNANVREILDSIPDHDLQLNNDDVNSSCNNSTSLITADVLTEGLVTWHFARVNTVSGGDPLIRFIRDDNGAEAVLAAVGRLPNNGGEVVLVGDIEGFVMNCAATDPSNPDYDYADEQAAFWRNLFGEASSNPPDNDNDGFDVEVDCNDDDPTINPGAEEDCDNGVDDDCDDAVDSEDDECTGADDDDDDLGSDDDDADPFGDDDGPGGAWGDDVGCCGGASLGPSGSSPGAGFLVGALTLLLGLGRRQRRDARR